MLPEWLRQRYLEPGRPIFGASHVVVGDFDYMEIETAIKNLCRSIEGRDWSEIASRPILALYQYSHGRRVQVVKISDSKKNYPLYGLNGKLLVEDNRQTLKRTEYIYAKDHLTSKRIRRLKSQKS